MHFVELGQAICGTEKPTFLGLFDFSTAPTLLFYAYVPIVLVSLFLGLFLATRKEKTLQSRWLQVVLAFFVLWVLNILVQWVSSYHVALMFAWQLTALFEIGIYISSFYLAYAFINKRDLPAAGKIALSLSVIVTALILPTKFNVSSYDILNCQGTVGIWWQFLYYVLEPAIIISTLVIGIVAVRKETDLAQKREVALFSAAFVVFLSTFYGSNLYGQITGAYVFNLWGPLGLAAFFGALGYLVVKFQTFHIKLFAAQALVWGLVALIGAQFFYVTTSVSLVLDAVTFVSAVIFGAFLIRSVSQEVKQREQLADALRRRESLEHLVTHKVKGAFTRLKFIFSGELEGSFGPMTDQVRQLSRQGLEFSNEGIDSVDQVLNVDNLKRGGIRFEMKPIDLKPIVEQAVEQKREPAERKGLELSLLVEQGTYNLIGDAYWLKEVIYNLVDNAVKYSLSGQILVEIRNTDIGVRFSVKDNGVGISDEDKKILFTEGGRGKNSLKINVDSTGYGLYTIKLIIDAHKGKVWVESEVGKGSTFFVELPRQAAA